MAVTPAAMLSRRRVMVIIGLTLSILVVAGVGLSVLDGWRAAGGGGVALVDQLIGETPDLRLVATAIVYAWLYNSSGGSLLIVMLAHAGHNIAVRLVPLDATLQHGDPVVALLYVLAATIVVALSGPHWLSRKRIYPAVAPSL